MRVKLSKDVCIVRSKEIGVQITFLVMQVLNFGLINSNFCVCVYIVFSYKANQDSVVQVSEADYKNCSTASPIANYSDGHTMIKLNQSGPHYFISGVVDHCKNHEKLMIIVLAGRSSHSTPSPSPSAAPPHSLPPAPSSDEFPSPPPAPSTPENDHHTPAPAPSDDNNPPPPTPSGASSFVVNFFCSVGTFVGFSLLV